MWDVVEAIFFASGCFLTGLYARHLGRRPVLWFCLSLFLITPFIGIPLLALMGRSRKSMRGIG